MPNDRDMKAYTRVYPKVSGLAAWSEKCIWYISLPLGAVVSLFVSQYSEFCHYNPLCCFSTSVYFCKHIFHYRLSLETFGYTLVDVASKYFLSTRHKLDVLRFSNTNKETVGKTLI
jgi:hypothetical protein